MKKQEKHQLTVGDERYKFYQSLVCDERFTRRVSEFRMKMRLLGHPVSELTDEESVKAWIATVHASHFKKKMTDPDYIKKRARIVGDRDTFSYNEMLELDELEDELLPPYPYFQPLINMLTTFMNEKRDKKKDEKPYTADSHDREFITRYALLGEIIYNKCRYVLQLRYGNSNTPKTPELWVRIMPDTRRSDIEDGWEFIKQTQQTLPGYKVRSRRIDTSESRLDGRTANAARVQKHRLNKRIGMRK